MRSPRLLIAALVLAAFLVGLSLGYALFGGAPVGAAVAGGANGSNGGAGSGSSERGVGSSADGRQVSSFGLAGQDDGALEGDALMSRMWTTLTNPDEDARHVEWIGLLKHMTKEDALKVREMFKKMDKEGRRFTFEWDSFWPRWGQVDGDGALEFLKTNEWPSWRNDAAAMLARGWASADPAAARRWLDEHKDSAFHDGAERGYFDGLARANLPRATQEAIADATGDPARMSKAMETLAEHALQQHSLTGMVDWWNALPDDPASGSAKREAIGHVWYRLQFGDPDRAAEWIGSLAGGPFRSDLHIQQTTKRLAESNPVKAMDWVASLPPSPTSGMYANLGGQLRQWAGNDQPAAEAWLKAQPASPARDQAYTAYGYYLQSQSAPEAQQWLDAVQDKAWLTKKYGKSISVRVLDGGRAAQTKEEILVP